MAAKNRLQRIIYGTFFKTTVPAFVGLGALFLASFVFSAVRIDSGSRTVSLANAHRELSDIARRKSKNINLEMQAVAELALVLQKENQRVFSRIPPAAAGESFGFAANGVFYKTADDGGASVFYSTRTRIGPEQRRKAERTQSMDSLFKSVKESDPKIVAVYFNSSDSMCRYYPFIPDVFDQFPADMDIPAYNFYYLADASRDPERKPVWTEAYLDPAGKGWMASCVVPVYDEKGILQGVTGIDITIAAIVENVLSTDLPYRATPFLVDKMGVILAMPEAAESIFGLKELKQEVYGKVHSDTFKPEDFNLLGNKGSDTALRMEELLTSGKTDTEMEISGKPYVVAQGIVESSGWRFMAVMDKKEAFALSESLMDSAYAAGAVSLGAIALVLAALLLVMVFRAKILAVRVTGPMAALTEQAEALKSSFMDASARVPNSGITEIDELAQVFNELGQKLKESYEGLERKVEERTLQLEEEKRKAEAANKAKSLFISNMSHELRTPMNAILGYAQLMRRERGVPSKTARYIEIINRSGEHLLALINDILEIARIEARKTVRMDETFDFRALLEELENMFRIKSDEKGLSLVFETAPDVPERILSDQGKLRQILINLLGNAAKFTEEGTIIVRSSMAPPRDGNTRIRVEVEDTGKGISAEEQGKLFQYFEQTASGIETGGGTGLGLAISREYARILGGDIEVQSERGAGSRFTLTFSARMGSDAPKREAIRRVQCLKAGSQKPRILVADDTEDSRNLLAELLEAAGMEVGTARDGIEAVEACGEWRPDLVFMDIRMPRMDGIEAAKRIKERFGKSGPALVALSASVMAEDRESLVGGGFDDFVHKPFKEMEIFDRIAAFTAAQYEYEEPGQTAPARSGRRGGRAIIEKASAEALREAALRLDKERVDAAAAAIGDEQTRSRIAELADRFDFDGIIALVDTSREKDDRP